MSLAALNKSDHIPVFDRFELEEYKKMSKAREVESRDLNRQVRDEQQRVKSMEETLEQTEIIQLGCYI